MRKFFLMLVFVSLLSIYGLSHIWKNSYQTLWVLGPLMLLGFIDILQKKHAVLRNFPVIGHFRYWLELIRPEIQQYFIESQEDGRPFSREQRSIVYQRAKKDLDTLPFGTQLDLYNSGAEWINHSIAPKEKLKEAPRVKIGNNQCDKPYEAALLNISAMSYGSLSKNAVMALNKGAKLGNFYHNTGEGGVSPYHLEPGGDLVWQIGTGYFSCRAKDGNFSAEKFQERVTHENIKMLEIKLSQGAKPGHGGILPAAKVSEEIAKIRGVEIGKTVISPPYHKAFATPIELLNFIEKIRTLSNGKPVGFKLCVGKRREFFAICKAMLETKIYPDFITIDGAEGGTGAAPIEFSNSVGTPLSEGLIFIHNALVGSGLRDKVKLIASGKIISGFHIASKIAIGADLCNSARGMMFALGCIQALRCNSNHCPTGVATQNPELMAGLDVTDKSVRVANFQKSTLHSFLEVLAASGLDHPTQLRPWHIHRRLNDYSVKHYGEIFTYLEPESLTKGMVPHNYKNAWENSTAMSF